MGWRRRAAGIQSELYALLHLIDYTLGSERPTDHSDVAVTLVAGLAGLKWRTEQDIGLQAPISMRQTWALRRTHHTTCNGQN